MLHNGHLPIFVQINFFSADVATLKFQKLLRNFFLFVWFFMYKRQRGEEQKNRKDIEMAQNSREEGEMKCWE